MLEEDGEAEVGGLKGRVLVLVEEEEVLGLEISVHDSHGVASVHDLHDGPEQRRGSPFGVVALGNDPVEELPSGAELHDEVDRVLVLIGALELHDVWLAGEVVHDLDLPPDILDVLLVRKLPLRDGLAGELLPGGLVGAQAGHTELASPQLLPNRVDRLQVLHGPAKDRPDRSRLGRLGGGP